MGACISLPQAAGWNATGGGEQASARTRVAAEPKAQGSPGAESRLTASTSPLRARKLWPARKHDSARSLGAAAGAGAGLSGALAALLGGPTAPGGGGAAAAAPNSSANAASASRGPDFGASHAYEVIELLGAGGSGEAYLCRPAGTQELVAVKLMQRPLPKVAVPLLMREFDLQSHLGEGHPNIVSARELVLTDTHLGLAQDFVSGGTLAEAVGSRWESALERGGLHLTEAEASFFFSQLASAVAYLHEHRVAHRDLKLDNTLLDGPLESAPRIMLCDFGFARSWGADGSGDMHTALGTPAYMSPQILGAKYGTQGFDGAAADSWAAGVTLFVMLFGCFPFDHHKHKGADEEEAHLEVRMEQEKLTWRDNKSAARAIARGHLSADCAALLDRLLEMDESMRISMREAAAHPWLVSARGGWSDAQLATWEGLQADIRARHAGARPLSPEQLKQLRSAMLAMLAAAARTAADAPLHAIGAPPARAPGAPAQLPPRAPRKGRQADSMPLIDQVGAAGRRRASFAGDAPLGADADADAGAAELADAPAAPAAAAAAALEPQPSWLLSAADDLGESRSAGSPGSASPPLTAGSSAAGGGAGGSSSGDSEAAPAATSAANAAGGAGSLPDWSVHSAGGPAAAAASASGAVAPWGITCGPVARAWRLPLQGGVPDAALAIPLPHLRVAAGALVSELQRSTAGRGGRALASRKSVKRMSWPMQPAAAGLGAEGRACVCQAPFAGM